MDEENQSYEPELEGDYDEGDDYDDFDEYYGASNSNKNKGGYYDEDEDLDDDYTGDDVKTNNKDQVQENKTTAKPSDSNTANNLSSNSNQISSDAQISISATTSKPTKLKDIFGGSSGNAKNTGNTGKKK